MEELTSQMSQLRLPSPIRRRQREIAAQWRADEEKLRQLGLSGFAVPRAPWIEEQTSSSSGSESEEQESPTPLSVFERRHARQERKSRKPRKPRKETLFTEEKVPEFTDISTAIDQLESTLNQFQLELVLANRRFTRQGMRNIIQKRVEARGPRGGHHYTTYDGTRWNDEPIRMNARQLRDQREGILSGCVEGCEASGAGLRMIPRK